MVRILHRELALARGDTPKGRAVAKLGQTEGVVVVVVGEAWVSWWEKQWERLAGWVEMSRWDLRLEKHGDVG